MPTEIPRVQTEVDYKQSAEDYLYRLTTEHFMEATPQATQRSITLASFQVVKAYRPDIQLFNELLVQYPLPGHKRLSKVVPDNMVVVHPEPIKAGGSYDIPEQPVGPFWVLEYVSKSSKRKDYEDNLERYEQDLKVPYYLSYDPEEEKLIVYRMTDERYVFVRPNEYGRLAVPQLEMEVGVKDGWARFWFRDELVPLPDDLLRSFEAERKRADEATQACHAKDEEIARLRALLEHRNRRPGENP